VPTLDIKKLSIKEEPLDMNNIPQSPYTSHSLHKSNTNRAELNKTDSQLQYIDNKIHITSNSTNEDIVKHSSVISPTNNMSSQQKIVQNISYLDNNKNLKKSKEITKITRMIPKSKTKSFGHQEFTSKFNTSTSTSTNTNSNPNAYLNLNNNMPINNHNNKVISGIPAGLTIVTVNLNDYHKDSKEHKKQIEKLKASNRIRSSSYNKEVISTY